MVEQHRQGAFRPWPLAVLRESGLLQVICPLELRPSLTGLLAELPVRRPVLGRRVARAGADLCAKDDSPQAMERLGEAGRRSARDTAGYAALQGTILANGPEAAVSGAALKLRVFRDAVLTA
jgi:hypothetical protein